MIRGNPKLCSTQLGSSEADIHSAGDCEDDAAQCSHLLVRYKEYIVGILSPYRRGIATAEELHADQDEELAAEELLTDELRSLLRMRPRTRYIVGYHYIVPVRFEEYILVTVASYVCATRST